MNSENTQNNEQMIELEDKTYRLEEMSEAMKASIANSEEVINQQRELVDLIKSSERAEKFEEFMTDVDEQIKNMSSQNSILNIRVALLDQVIEACKNDENVAKIITMFVNAVGMFAQN